MVVNNLRTMEMLHELRASPLTPALLQEIHATLTHGTLANPADEGRFQTASEERVTIRDAENHLLHQPPPVEELPGRIDRLCAFANDATSKIPSTLRAMMLHFQLAFDHPFVDGNGPTARALFYWAMLRNGAWLARYLAISPSILKARAQYARAFIHAEQTGDLTYFLLYHTRVVRLAIEGLTAHLTERRTRMHQAERTLRGIQGLNGRQRMGIQHALREPEARWDGRRWAAAHGVTLQTALTDLRSLLDGAWFVLDKVGRRSEFYAVTHLAARLQGGSGER